MSAVVPSFSFQRGWRKTEMTVQTPRLQSCPLTEIQESIIFQGPQRHEEGGAGFVSMETSSVVYESSRSINPREKKKKNQWRVQSLTRFFFSSFSNIFLKCRFWVVYGGGCIFSVTILISKLEVQSHRKQCLCLICRDAAKDPKKKALHIYIKKFGVTRLFLAVLTVFIHECLTAQFSCDLWHD